MHSDLHKKRIARGMRKAYARKKAVEANVALVKPSKNKAVQERELGAAVLALVTAIIQPKFA